jgi:GNAT superfamily N-acetyltransferase
MTTTFVLKSEPYAIRPGRRTDRAEVAEMIRARAGWMRERGCGRWSGWDRDADVLAGQLGEPEWPTWVITAADRIVGVTTATFETPFLGWTEQEQTEPALFLQSTVTHPEFAGAGIGILIAFWALDHAARHDRKWVRRGVLTLDHDNLGLVRYYRSQGWRVTRSIPHPRRPKITVWSLQRPAARQLELVE